VGEEMEFEHLYQEAAYISAIQMMILGAILAAGVAGYNDLYRRFMEKVTSCVVTFGPISMLIYVLYSISHLS
jgi:hypothetical protein